MANVKRVVIDALVPFDYLDHLSDVDRAGLACWFLSPTWGIKHEFEPAGFVPNDHGGRTAMYRLRIRGVEAVSFPAFDSLVAILKTVGGVARAECVDVEAGSGKGVLPAYDAYDAKGRRIRVTVPESER